MINKFDNALDKDPLQCTFKIEFEKNTPSGKDTHLDNIMSYNNILDYIERENNNEDSKYWRFRKILSHSLVSGKKEKDDKIEIQWVWETGATSTECFEALKKDISIDLAICTKENNLLKLGEWRTLKKLADRSKLTEQLVKQTKLHSLKYSTMYKYGFKVSKSYKDTKQFNIKMVTITG